MLEGRDRRRVIVYAQVNRPVIQPFGAAARPDHEQRRRLLPPAVAAGGLGRRERGHQPLGEIVATAVTRVLERLGERREHVGARQHVALAGIALSRTSAGPGKTLCAGVVCGMPMPVNDADLPPVPPGVGGGDLRQHGRRRPALCQ